MRYDVVVIGGGAAGLMCAATAGARGRSVLVLDHANRVGKKILMSGGGRCNFTNLGVTPAQYLSANPHFCKSALARYTQWDFIALVEKHRVAFHEKELGQLFCDESSKQILRLLLDECDAAGVQIRTECSVQQIDRGESGFVLHTTLGALACERLVVATGGLSIPKMGATGYGYQLARQFGHRVLATRAGLVPLTLSGTHLGALEGLSGLALDVEARCGKTAFRGGMLITHRGLSGPAMLQISSYWQPGEDLRLDLLPGRDAAADFTEAHRSKPNLELRSLLGDWLPKRYAQRLCDTQFGHRPLRQYKLAELRDIAAQLHDWPIIASGTEGYRTAEVTLGGVDTDEMSSATMESNRVPGLYFIGEVVDVTGWLGGYNFQWAWSSAVAAGRAM